MVRYVKPELRRRAKQMRSAQSSLEQWLWRELRAKRLDGWKFRYQVPIDFYIVDFVCFEARLIVEADGPLHNTDEQRLWDAERDQYLTRQGFRILRFDQDSISRAIGEIRQSLGTRALTATSGVRRPLPAPD
jgi:very-short-patch-repair endonuclease